METNNLPARENTLFRMLQDPALKKQLQLAIPKHMTVERLLRVAMTVIRATPKLMDCTPKSLMICIMGCAQLGLSPEPFLGQAYFVPFNVNAAPKGQTARWEMQATLIPGYRGYIALARRSGEVQNVTAQAVYTNYEFRIQFGLHEELSHIPTDEKRGEFRGAYVIFRYKDGSHSFDWMTKDRIEKVRERSKAKDSGPWVTDYDEMGVKTVIRHHVKLVPLSVELAKAAHLEERAMIGEDQADLIFGEAEGPELIEGTTSQKEETPGDKFEELVKREDFTPQEAGDFNAYISAIAGHSKISEDAVKAKAMTDFDKFVNMFRAWAQKRREKAEEEAKVKSKKKEPAPPAKAQEPAPVETAAPALAPEGPFESKLFPDFQSASLASINTETGEVKDPTVVINCPEDSEPRAYGWCKDECPTFVDCRGKQ